jgi:hypothetical protein
MVNRVVFSVFPGPMLVFRKDGSLALARSACIMVQRAVLLSAEIICGLT